MLLAESAVHPVTQAWTEFVGLLHPVVLHFPLALLLVGAAAVLWNWFRGEEGIGEFAFHCIWIGAAMALVAAASGWFMAEDEAGEQGLELHRWFGVGSAAAAGVLAAMASLSRTDARPGLLGMTRILALVTAAGIGWTGHLGGEMVWGESRLGGKFVSAVGTTWDHYRSESASPAAAEPSKPAEAAKSAEPAVRPAAVAPPPPLPEPSAPVAHPGAVRGSESMDPEPQATGKSGDKAPPAAPADKSGVPAPIPPRKPVSYKEDLLPLLKDRCFECHSGDKPKDGVGFDHMSELIKKEGKRAVVMKGDPTKSTLFTTIMRGDDSKKRMPPPKDGPRLTPEQAGIIQAWIKEGARLDN